MLSSVSFSNESSEPKAKVLKCSEPPRRMVRKIATVHFDLNIIQKISSRIFPKKIYG